MVDLHIYVYDKFKLNTEQKISSKDLFYTALKDYCSIKNIHIDTDKIKIQKGEKGKPFVENLDICFNISHSSNYWICAFSPYPVGIDIQTYSSKKIDKIAARYFTKNEQDYILKSGNLTENNSEEKAFYKIWTIKEAYAKYFGESIFNVINTIETVRDNKILNNIAGINLYDINLQNISCTVASKDDKIICIKKIDFAL